MAQSMTDKILQSLDQVEVARAVSDEFESLVERLSSEFEEGRPIRPTLHHRAILTALINRGRTPPHEELADQARAVTSHSTSIRRVSEALGWRRQR